MCMHLCVKGYFNRKLNKNDTLTLYLKKTNK